MTEFREGVQKTTLFYVIFYHIIVFLSCSSISEIDFTQELYFFIHQVLSNLFFSWPHYGPRYDQSWYLLPVPLFPPMVTAGIQGENIWSKKHCFTWKIYVNKKIFMVRTRGDCKCESIAQELGLQSCGIMLNISLTVNYILAAVWSLRTKDCTIAAMWPAIRGPAYQYWIY